jgi:hypothetical protein
MGKQAFLLNSSKHSPDLIWSSFIHEQNFDLLLFSNILFLPHSLWTH